MATTWYVDPEGGNDSNAGTSFALRKRTFSMSSLAGDSVRLIASPDPASLGSATWTDNSGTITLAAAQTLTIDNCDTAWVAGTNVTASTSTTTSRKQGTAAATFTIAAGFTGGLIGYKAVSNLDLSAYSCVSMWMYTFASNYASGINVALCSDSAGLTPIVTLSFPAWLVTGGAQSFPLPILFENGGAALPSGVNSIALYASTRPFGSLGIDNVIAAKAYGAAGHLSHGCLFGKNSVAEPEWYPIMSIDGTTVVLGNQKDFAANTPAKNYRGTSESVTTYAVSPLRQRYNGSWGTGSATQAAPISVTGGWDRTAMASQTGVSWMSGENNCAIGMNLLTQSYIYLPDSTIGWAHYTNSATGFSQGVGRVFHILGAVDCSTGINTSTLPYGGVGGVMDLDLGNVVWQDNPLEIDSAPYGGYKLRVRRITGTRGIGYIPAQTNDDAMSDIAVGMIDNCTFALSCTIRARVRGTTFKNNSTATVSDNSQGLILLDRPVLGDSVINTFSATIGHTILRCTAVNGNRWDNRVYMYGVTQTTDQSVVHGATAQSVKLVVNDYGRSLTPYCVALARVAMLAGQTGTVKVWTQRTTQFITTGLLTRSGSVAGVADASVAGSAANNTWELVSISFTPTEDGVVTVYGTLTTQQTTSANGTQAWFGDMTVTST